TAGGAAWSPRARTSRRESTKRSGKAACGGTWKPTIARGRSRRRCCRALPDRHGRPDRGLGDLLDGVLPDFAAKHERYNALAHAEAGRKIDLSGSLFGIEAPYFGRLLLSEFGSTVALTCIDLAPAALAPHVRHVVGVRPKE